MEVHDIEQPLETIKFPNFDQASGKNADQLLYRNHLQKLALIRFKESLTEFKQKQKELSDAREMCERKETELKEVYLKTLPYLEVVKDISTTEEEELKEWDDSVSSSFDVLKKYLIYKPLTVVKDKTVYIAKEGIQSLPEHYQEKIYKGVDVISGYVPCKSLPQGKI